MDVIGHPKRHESSCPIKSGGPKVEHHMLSWDMSRRCAKNASEMPKTCSIFACHGQDVECAGFCVVKNAEGSCFHARCKKAKIHIEAMWFVDRSE